MLNSESLCIHTKVAFRYDFCTQSLAALCTIAFTRLRLSNCSMGDAEAFALTSLIATGTQLKELICDRNFLGPPTILQMAPALSRSVLQTLVLALNQLDDDSAIALADATATHPYLECVELWGTGLGC